MNIVVQKSDLSRALQFVQSSIARRTTMPILSNILLSASAKQLRVSASDLELSALASCKAEVKGGGTTTVNAKIFTDLVRELPEGEVRLNLGEGERLEVVAKGSKFKIVGVSAEEYPTLPGLSCNTTGTIPANVLLEMVNKTLYAVSTDETRFVLNGACLECEADEKAKGKKGASTLRMVATDGHRLALISRAAGSLAFSGRVIVPRKGLSEMRRVLEAEGEKEIGVGVTDGFFVLEGSEVKMACRLIDNEYPEYGQVLPKQKGVKASVNSAQLAQSLRRVMLMVSDKEKGVRLAFSPGALRITSSSPELGEASDELEVDYKGDVVTVGFNAHYLLDVASTLGGEQNVVMELHGELGPGKFSGEGDESAFAIVMPMRL